MARRGAPLVIIGAGHAGVALAEALRTRGFDGAIRIVGAEDAAPYQRPPLSKEVMAGTAPVPLRAEKFYRDNEIDLVLGESVSSVDSATRHLVVGGARMPYTDVVVATGAQARRLPGAEPEVRGMHTLRSSADAQRLGTALEHARSVVVVGAGFLGMEFAALTHGRDVDVTVLTPQQRVLDRSLSTVTSDHLSQEHCAAGVSLHTSEGVQRLEVIDGAVRAVIGTSGRRYRADLVLIAIGADPAVQALLASGVDGIEYSGIDVDPFLRARSAHVWAIGDCARFPNVHTGTVTRVESVQNANDQARTLARTLTGEPTRYTDLPWFWTTQGRSKVQIAGMPVPDPHTVIRQGRKPGSFDVFCYRGGSLRSVESINSPAAHLAARRLLSAGLELPAEVAADPEIDLKNHVHELISHHEHQSELSLSITT